ncbi:MAG: DUF3786 domain-containing protein [Deltaproteobacteria bacterium]|nr:DUF3786 domain-containing protein [Deltaproteobacteria bacterium]MBW2678860.1 DUF3786 domain-containing protein [Deltaproteobacteria bacterium]
MAGFSNAMEIFKLLDKSNCRKCNQPTCLAFAGAVYQGRKQLGDCPVIDADVIKRYEQHEQVQPAANRDLENMLAQVKSTITSMDLSAAAHRLGTTYAHDRLTLKTLGKNFTIDTNGEIYTDIHVHGWLLGPVLNYITHSKGRPESGTWLPFRELAGGKTRYRLFEQRCEKALKHIADTYTDLFEDMIHIFNGRPVENHYKSDISLVLYPLPKFPILICYWRPEDGLESDMNIFFDAVAEENLDIDMIYTISAGLIVMFEKLALRHGIK